MIERDPRSAEARVYDLIVVGGGIYGVALTLESARRGLRPLLLERQDYGGETSWNSLRIVHGGLRYLQSLDLRRFRESVAERRIWMREFPDLLEIVPCVMPLYGKGLRRPSVFRVALALNDRFSAGRNVGVRSDRRLPPGRLISAREALELFPGLPTSGLQGAALWYDGAMPDSERLGIEMLHWATACGAEALNYVEARDLLSEGSSVRGVRAVEAGTGRTLEFRAPLVVNCAGPWCRELARRFDRDRPELFRPAIGFNVLADRKATSEHALAVSLDRGAGGTYFLHPWKGNLLIGTYHGKSTESSPARGVPEEMIRDFLGGLNRALPGFDLSRREVLRVHWGLLPAREDGAALTATREAIRHHGDDGGPAGLYSVSGVKYTTARLVAEKTLRRIADSRPESLQPYGPTGRPAAEPVPTADELERLMTSDEPAAAAVVRRLMERESVLHLDDLILRRTDWGADPRRGTSIGARIAPLTGWAPTRIESETRRLEGKIA